MEGRLEMFAVGPREGGGVLGLWEEATFDGADVGMELKLAGGSSLGPKDGTDDERNVGLFDIVVVGESLGFKDGMLENTSLGWEDGCELNVREGALDSKTLGSDEGALEGKNDGP